MNMEIKPGDLITAEMLNAILGRIETLEDQLLLLVGSVGTGPIVVPDLMGRTLAQTRSMLSQPNVNLNIGQAFDAFGNLVDIDLSSVQLRVVLNQHPMPGIRVATGSVIDIVLSASGQSGTGGNGGSPNLQPRVDAFVPTTPRIGETLRIEGANFSPFRAQNQVTFNGMAGTVLPASTPTALSVTIPNIQNPPAENETVSVTLILTTPTGSVTSEGFEIRGAATDTPTIETLMQNDTVVNPGGVIVVGSDLTISGSNYGESEDGIVVRLGTTDLTISSSDLASGILTVEVPSLPGHDSGAVTVNTQLVVSIDGQDSLGFNLSVADLSNLPN